MHLYPVTCMVMWQSCVMNLRWARGLGLPNRPWPSNPWPNENHGPRPLRGHGWVHRTPVFRFLSWCPHGHPWSGSVASWPTLATEHGFMPMNRYRYPRITMQCKT
jgi:hypothetical protein